MQVCTKRGGSGNQHAVLRCSVRPVHAPARIHVKTIQVIGFCQSAAAAKDPSTSEAAICKCGGFKKQTRTVYGRTVQDLWPAWIGNCLHHASRCNKSASRVGTSDVCSNMRVVLRLKPELLFARVAVVCLKSRTGGLSGMLSGGKYCQ